METIQDLGEFTFKALLKNSVKKFANRPALALAGDEKEIKGERKDDLLSLFREILHTIGEVEE